MDTHTHTHTHTHTVIYILTMKGADLLVSVTGPLITVIKHKHPEPQAPIITACQRPFRSHAYAHTHIVSTTGPSAKLLASAKNTNESNETEGKTGPEIYTRPKHL